jgi:hypothetical protein
MDILGWLFWLLKWLLSLAWSLVWLLLGGWVSTAAQILAILAGISVYRFGWRRAPVEVWGQLSGFVRFASNWMRGRDALAGRAPAPRETAGPERVRITRVKEAGDINLSTALSVVTLAGLCMLAAAMR